MFNALYKKYILKYYKIYLAVGGVILLSTVGFVFIYFFSKQNEKVNIPKTNDPVISDIEDKTMVDAEPTYYYVDIKGAITNPNVYQLALGSRVVDVIKMAGGLTEQADISVINLSKRITDEMVIIIYTKEEIKKFKEGNKPTEEIIKYIEKECNCPDPHINKACTNNETVSNNDSDDNVSKININTAVKEDLMTLTGIGEAKAQDIVEYRTVNGNFNAIEEIKNVTGIGESIFDKIKDNITI